VPAANPAGNFATISVLDDDTRVNVVESSFTTGAPVAVRLVPVMVICLVAEFTLALTIVGVCAWAIAAEQTSQATATPDLRIVSICLVSSGLLSRGCVPLFPRVILHSATERKTGSTERDIVAFD
jgi:hypothetical protein